MVLKVFKKYYSKDISRLQKKRWKKFQSTLLASPFYVELANANSPLAGYPKIEKASFMANFNYINTKGIDLEDAFSIALKSEQSRNFAPMIGEVTVGLSSGTSGNRGVFLATEKERAQWVACVLDRVIGFSLKNRSVAFFLRANSNLYNSVKSNVLSFHFFDLLDDIQQHIVRLNNLNPTILVAQPSMLLELAKFIEKKQLVIQPQKIISVAEVLYPEDKVYLEKIFSQTIHQVYQCTEGLLASTCKNGTLHFHEDYLIIEKNYIDDTKTRFHPVITDLIRSSQPIVRYELNDIVHEKTNCDCDLKTLAIEQIEGRSDDILTFIDDTQKEFKIFPDFFRRAIIVEDATITDYLVIGKNNNQLELYIDGDDKNYTNAKNGILNLLHSFNITQVEINRIPSKKLEKGNKLRRIKNEHYA
jgi:putative adenylate-forming enzyme